MGKDSFGPDYNPLLETVSTIKSSESDLPITAIAGASGSVRFPHDMRIDEGEDFVKEINGLSFSIKKEDVWKETNEPFYDKIRGQRIVQGYGTTQSREMAT